MDFFEQQRSHEQRSRLLYGLFFAVIFAHFLLGAVLLWVMFVFLFNMAGMTMMGLALVSSAILMLLMFGMGAITEAKNLKLGGRAVAKQANAKRLFIDSEPSNWQHQDTETAGVRVTEQSMVVQDATLFPPQYRRYHEIATQMSIAAGLPMPALYVLPFENGINAFVAGRKSSDTVMVVSEGALQKLSDEALYGLIAHEYGHILHGDADFNLTMLIVMAGLNMGYAITSQAIDDSYSAKNYPDNFKSLSSDIDDSWSAITARQRAQSDMPVVTDKFNSQQWVDYWKTHGTVAERYAIQSSWTRDADADTDGSGVLVPAMAGYILFGSSIYFGKLIKHHFSCQREFLADATSMQITRSNAIIETLKAISHDTIGSTLNAERLAKFDHFYFADFNGQNRADQLSSHPSINDRLTSARRFYIDNTL